MDENKNDIQLDVKLSEDAQVVKQIGPWTFYLSRLQHALFIEVTDYHAAPLKISKKDLCEFLGFIEQQEECIFCKKAKSENIIIENDYAYAMLDNYPVSEGHTLIIPKRHFADYFDITKKEYNAIHDLTKIRRKQLLEQDSTIQGFNVGANSGEVAGQTVWHCHVHLIPRRKGDTENPRGGVRGVIPSKMDF